MTTQTNMKQFKEAFFLKFGCELDFRAGNYLDNNYGLTPAFDYGFAEWVIDFLFTYCNLSAKYQNTGMMIEKLRTTSLKCTIESYLDEMKGAN